MRDNKIIRTAQTLCRLIQGLLIFFAGLFTIVLIHWHFAPEFYDRVEISNALQAGFGNSGFRVFKNFESTEAPGTMMLNELSHGMAYWLYLRTLLFMGITFLIVGALRQILSSVQTLETFRSQNIAAFQFIGRYALWLTALSSFNVWYFDGNWNLHLAIPGGPLLVAVLGLVMAEIFKEGNQLMEDSKLTI